MSKVTIAGNAMVITSALKLADIQTVKKFRPEALNLMGGENGKELVFSIGLTDGCGCIGNVAAFFGNVADSDGFATITTVVENFGTDKKAFVSDNFGGAIVKLNALEKSIPAALAEIKEQKEAVEGAITVA